MAVQTTGVAQMVVALVVALVTYVLTGILSPLFATQPRRNFRGESIPTSLGLSFIISSSVFLVSKDELLFALILVFFGLLGLVDDFLGSNDAKGLRGHFTESYVSSGVLKAFGALAFAWAISLNLTKSFGDHIINALIMASAANIINLLDLRPGRAGKAFLVMALPLILITPVIRGPFLIISGAVLGYLFWDLRGDVMMGDAGSNALGAALGLGIVWGTARIGKIIILVIFLALNLFAERISFSQVIEDNPILNFLDRLGR